VTRDPPWDAGEPAALLASLLRIFGVVGGGWARPQGRQSIQAVYVEPLRVREHRVLLFLCFLSSLLCQF
jgi:hypothetical protein